MTAPFATLNGADRIVSGIITIPYYGLWSADVVIAVPDVVPFLCTLQIGDLSLVGFATRTASFAGTRSTRLVGGFGGWRNVVPGRFYQNPTGVMLSLVLRDLAIDAGEKVYLSTDSSVGQFFVRDNAPAQRALRLLAGAIWYVDGAGTTQVGPRPSKSITSQFNAIHYSGGKGLFDIATETLSDWMPGNTFTTENISTAQTISSVTHSMSNDGTVRTEALAI